MIRDFLSITDLELLIKLNKSPLNKDEIADILQVEKGGIPVYIHRLKKKGLVENKSPMWSEARYSLTDKGNNIIIQLRKELA